MGGTNTPADGITVERLDDGRLELVAADDGPVRLAPEQVRPLLAEMIIACMPDGVLANALMVFEGRREDMAIKFVSPARALGYRTAFELCATEEGREQVSKYYRQLFRSGLSDPEAAAAFWGL